MYGRFEEAKKFNGYRFSECGCKEEDLLKGNYSSEIEQLINLQKKKILSRTEKDFLFRKIYSCTFFKKGIALQGWYFDFSNKLKRFWVKSSYGDLHEYFAFDKMCLRNNLYTKSNIFKIVEVVE